MTTLLEAREVMYQAFETGIGATAHCYDNEQFTPPAGAIWTRLSVRHLLGEQETLGETGNRKFARTGLVLVQVFTPVDTGVRVTDTLVTTIRNIFEGKHFSGVGYTIWLRGGTTRELGIDDGYWQTIVEIPFYYNEIR